MLHIDDGQCGLCQHFGADHKDDQQLVQIRLSHEAPADLKEECGHPKHEPLNLMVTPISGCEGFQPVAA